MNSKKMSKVGRYVLNIFVIVILLVGLSIVHEFSHGITAIMTGNIIKKISFVPFTCNVWIINLDSIPIIAVSGSIGAFVVSLILFIIGIWKSNLSLLVSGTIKMMMECFYWFISPILEFGDAFIFYRELGINNSGVFSIVFLFFNIFIFSLFVFVVDNLRNRKSSKIIKSEELAGCLIDLKLMDIMRRVD